MKRAIVGLAAVAAVGLAPLFVAPAHAHADDPCVGITDPVAYQACIDRRDNPMRRYQGNCDAAPFYGQEGQLCRDFWVPKSVPPDVALFA